MPEYDWAFMPTDLPSSAMSADIIPNPSQPFERLLSQVLISKPHPHHTRFLSVSSPTTNTSEAWRMARGLMNCISPFSSGIDSILGSVTECTASSASACASDRLERQARGATAEPVSCRRVKQKEMRSSPLALDMIGRSVRWSYSYLHERTMG